MADQRAEALGTGGLDVVVALSEFALEHGGDLGQEREQGFFEYLGGQSEELDLFLALG